MIEFLAPDELRTLTGCADASKQGAWLTPGDIRATSMACWTCAS